MSLQKKYLFLTFSAIILVSSCIDKKNNSDPLIEIINNAPQMVRNIIDSASYEVQIIYTQIERDQAGHPHLQSFYINRDDDSYFYPASTVKMPVAFLALQRIKELQQEEPRINMYSSLVIEAGHPSQQGVSIDSSSPTLRPQVAHYVEQIFSVSDNDAYNRLYEFLGQDYINQELRDKGIFDHSRIRTRVGISGYDTESNRYTNPLKIVDKDEQILYQQDEYEAIYRQFLELNNSRKGKGFYSDRADSIVYEAFDMSEKNFINLVELEASLRRVIFPILYDSSEQFNISQEHYDFLYTTMPKTPLDFSFHQDKAEKYNDSYVKFFFNGDNNDPIPDHIKIFNKVGWAYGTLTDCSYIVDLKNNIDFFLSATILVNKNGIFNDGVYEYEEKGLPFLSALGAATYDYELKRKRVYQADFSRLTPNLHETREVR